MTGGGADDDELELEVVDKDETIEELDEVVDIDDVDEEALEHSLEECAGILDSVA
jgi:hypothetical protein